MDRIVKAGPKQTEEAVKWQNKGWIHDYNAPNWARVLKIRVKSGVVG
ncbi:MAG: hypothetical protein QXH91_01835 [Candidatus Bathyarchaeia archaeon]